jgi:branched-chain amino acid transport system substrate-binding protein
MMHDMYLVEVKTPSESKAKWDYYKVLRRIPADEAAQPLSESKCSLVKSLSENIRRDYKVFGA